jgi:dTDP-4-amino-4,6-dideoxygalactose transaminase
MIPFNKPYLSGKETEYIKEAVLSGKISGNGLFTSKCHDFFSGRYGYEKCLLTSSCTDALEMAAILAEVKEGDEVIMPSYTFVSTANAFVLRGAKIVFADSEADRPHIDASTIEKLITERTKVIVPVHYAGMACDMDRIMTIAEKYDLLVIEDAAQSIDSYYKGKPLGSIGHLSAFSFHETKNIISGEGGMLVINDPHFINRAEIIWEKGTNRASFWRGEVDKYGWVDIGSSFLPSEITAAFLYAQLECLESIQAKRLTIWDHYYQGFRELEKKSGLRLPVFRDYSTNNAHMFYIICNSLKERTDLISFLKGKGIQAVFHYQGLHNSMYYRNNHDKRELINSDHFTDTLLRFPMFFDLTEENVEHIVNSVGEFYIRG